MNKALVLLSGGLDSMLAARILMEQGVEVTGLSFKSHFFSTQKAHTAADNLGIKLIEIDFSEEHLAMVKNPAHGYGKNMNPCIDCHGMMLKKAKEVMGKEKYDFVATGEVLGQRPMSQNKESLKMVAKISGLENNVVRPLSAKLLDETAPEKEGKVLRRRLLDISGRTRERQTELAAKYGIKDYPTPAGGCLLTDPEFSQRLIKLFDYWPDADGNDVEILKNGRTFWFSLTPNPERGDKILAIIGRNKENNESLQKLAKKGDIMVELKDEVGPLTVLRISNFQFPISNDLIKIDIPIELKMSELKLGEEKNEEEVLRIVALLTGYYATKARGKKVNIKLTIIN